MLAGLPAVAMAYIGEEVHPNDVGVTMGYYVGSGALGGMTGRLLTGTLVDYIPWRPALVIVGYFMMTLVKDIKWSDPGIGIPALLTILLMPFTYSITNGVGAGFLAYVILATIVYGVWLLSWPAFIVATPIMFASSIALRSEPSPESFVLVTWKIAASACAVPADANGAAATSAPPLKAATLRAFLALLDMSWNPF